jgi:hypothetical protein
MDRLVAPNSVPFSGADTAPTTGTAQYATDGNPGTTPATVFPAYAYNMLQDEMMAVITGAGLTPDRTNWGQLNAALGVLIGGGGSIVTNGWQKLPGGLIIQWGDGDTVTGGGDTVTLPAAYPNNHFNVVACEGHAPGWNISGAIDPVIYGVSGLTVSGFQISAARINMSASSVNYQAGLNYRYISLGN